MIRYSSKTITSEQLAKVIDHSLLRPELTEADVLAGCELAACYHVATVCVKPCHVTLAKEALRDSDVIVSTVVGFPHGSSHTPIKVSSIWVRGIAPRMRVRTGFQKAAFT